MFLPSLAVRLHTGSVAFKSTVLSETTARAKNPSVSRTEGRVSEGVNQSIENVPVYDS